MSQRIEDALEVLGLMRALYLRSPGRSGGDLRIEATRIVRQRGVAVDTVRAHYVNKNERNTLPVASVDRMAIAWLQDSSRDLENWYLETSDGTEAPRIHEFFSSHGGFTPEASDIDPTSPAERVPVEEYRILRDTALSRRVKAEMGYVCQMCSTTVRLSDRELYAESHHVRPLGGKHRGPDVRENIMCVCPTCHVLLDYGAVFLDPQQVSEISVEHLDYHNEVIARRAKETSIPSSSQ
jgi:hypothetical protein